MKEVLEFVGDELFVYTPSPQDGGICKAQLVMTKEIFQECYKKWIASQERYKPIILKEHDAEPRRLKAILDVETNDIYVHKITRETAECIGLTIEDRESGKEE